MRPRILFAPRFRGSMFVSDLRRALVETEPRAGESFRPILLVGLPRLAVLLAPLLGKRLTLVLDGAEALDKKLEVRLRALRVASFSFETYSKLRRRGVDAAFFDWAPAAIESDAPLRQGRFLESGLQAERRPALQDLSYLLSKPLWLAKLLSLTGRPHSPSGVIAATVAETAQCGVVYVGSPRAGGLNGDFLVAMGRSLVVYGPDRQFFRQFITHGVSGLLASGSLAPPPERGPAIGAMARRVKSRARRHFEADRGRLSTFVAGRPLERRTTAQVEWPAAPAGAGATPELAMQGGKRSRGDLREDTLGAPLITVAIVVRNARERFAPTLMSVLAQDYPNLEVVVVDGASTDGTRDEISVRDALLDYWVSARDNGPYDGMNKAARLARGRLLIFMNAGDFFPHRSAISHAFEDPDVFDADVVVGHHVYVEASGVECLHKAASFDETWDILRSGDISWPWLSGVPCGQAVFIRSQLLRDLPFDSAYQIVADHAFLYEAKRRGCRFAHCDSVIGVYTSGGLSGCDDRKTAKELYRLLVTYGPRDKIDTWFSVNMPYAFETN